MRYPIYEGNIERLEKKLTTIKNKCDKYGVTFNYEQVGEEFKTFTNDDGEEVTARYIIVEADGKMEHNGWKFVATLEHTPEGNLISGYGDIEVPARYYNCEAICEHCNSKRNRKNTYIIYNEESGEFKQVGKSCLNEFTMGMDADWVAKYISMFDELIQGEAPYGGAKHAHYFELKEMLLFFVETIKHFGYVRSQDYSVDRPTSSRASDYYRVVKGNTRWMSPKEITTLKQEMNSVGFDAYKQANVDKVDAMVDWILGNESDNNYFHNLKVLCKQKYIKSEDFGFVASIPATYDKNLEFEAEKKRREQEEKNAKLSSDFVGEVGQRIDIKVASARVLSTKYTEFGTTYFIKFTDLDGNVYIWSTSNGSSSEDDVKEIKATVKAHQEYNGLKQTVITRGKVTRREA